MNIMEKIGAYLKPKEDFEKIFWCLETFLFNITHRMLTKMATFSSRRSYDGTPMWWFWWKLYWKLCLPPARFLLLLPSLPSLPTAVLPVNHKLLGLQFPSQLSATQQHSPLHLQKVMEDLHHLQFTVTFSLWFGLTLPLLTRLIYNTQWISQQSSS